jgi:hypothetical protein
MLISLTLIFCFSYLCIALEHPLKVNKSATALMAAGLLWTVYALGQPEAARLNDELGSSLMSTAQIVFFLIEDAVASGTLAAKLVRQATKWNGHESYVLLALQSQPTNGNRARGRQ